MITCLANSCGFSRVGRGRVTSEVLVRYISDNRGIWEHPRRNRFACDVRASFGVCYTPRSIRIRKRPSLTLDLNTGLMCTAGAGVGVKSYYLH